MTFAPRPPGIQATAKLPVQPVTGKPSPGLMDGDADDENKRITKKLLTRLSQRDTHVRKFR